MSDRVPSAQESIPQTAPRAFWDRHKEEVMAAMFRVLNSGTYILGREVSAFEEEFARELGFTGAVGAANGTDAIVLALRALGVGPGDRVATVSHTAVATVAAIELAGALPVLVDIEPDIYTLDPAALGRTLEAVDGIKAVIAVHLYGHPADVPAIQQAADRFGIPVIEDCSQSHGAELYGRATGGMGEIGTFSFYPTKNLGAFGDGGMVVAKSTACITKLRMLREYGCVRRHVSEIPGMNSRLDELQAAILRLKLSHLREGNRRRAVIAAAYDAGLAGSGLALPARRQGATHVYHQYVIRHPDRDRLQSRLKEEGIGTNVHYPVPVHLQPAYAGRLEIDPAGLGASEAAAREVLSLPMYPEMTDETVARIVDAVRRSV